MLIEYRRASETLVLRDEECILMRLQTITMLALPEN